ncbi:cytochrome bd-I ubiquinol oxidase subunit 2 apoprotein [Lutibacter agarilyticus]|uniref:Cytochrome bd-I ubiquinol oxidase subunit 2 apoprotein n=1 Tax=Lutibacter agarilyticus TaxID=1109740 RepID=A0A238X7J9_9FLAO|nr:cytochrome d ubiquinol oxidase subunit II [Lutibacter agarilyticus]SNR54588.1 cytochrome bd-I ubiquinol oxidase subunit 2 apoprotein [Lutibacter agarilyticus]
MELFWYIVLMFMLGVYVILDGYDFGAGIIHLFFAKTEEDKSAITKSIGPFWDANEVWLIASGGILFFAFPTLYASSFSGFYLPLIMILWLLIFRATGLELRSQVNNVMWHKIWDKAFGISSLLLALFFGLALGNVVRGVNLGIVENGVSTQEAIYFFVPLWNAEFSPFSERLGIIDWFTILLGLLAVVALTIHGANWVIFKTNSSINKKLKGIIFKLNIVLCVLVLVSVVVWGKVSENSLQNFINHPWLFVFPFIGLIGLLNLFRIKKMKKDGLGFLSSSLFLFGAFASTAAALFPVLLPSTNTVNPSLTIYNTAADAYGLSVGVYWWVIAFILVIVYLIVQFRVFKGKMDNVPYGHH